MKFEWDEAKSKINEKKHDVSFEQAELAFFDIELKLRFNEKHSTKNEKRFFCYGKVNDKILTVRFTLINNAIRIIGAGYWREGRKYYYEEKI
jgi:uncharacterized DUF497 family protein